MPTPTFRVLSAAPVLLCACMLALTFAPQAGAKPKTTAADLRVVDSSARTLAEATQLTGRRTKAATSRKADCFGPGTGGSGEVVTIPDPALDVRGPTALGLLADAGRFNRGVRPLGLTDHFDFGIGVCGIGRAISPAAGYWYLKLNHEGSPNGGDQTQVRRGDDVLWYLIEDYNDPVPDELELHAPATAEPGTPFAVRVRSYGDDGTVSAAAGAMVTGADAPTDDRGRTTVTVSTRTAELRAQRGGSIPSNSVTVCTASLRDCPAGYAATIGGTGRADRISGGKAAERILAGAGRDVVDVRRGRAPDRINCGPGRDRLIVARGSGSKYRSCERVKVRR